MPLGSWYSQLPAFGWFDREDRPGSAALGVPDWQQGIALPSRRTLGQWYNVTPPGGGIPYPMQQTDIGPAKWTGRGVDISAAAAHQMGYTPGSFPTNANFKVEPRDEPRGLGSPAGMPVQAGDLPDNTTDTAYAPGPGGTARTPQGPKMSTSLMDMFQPQDLAGKPIGFNDAIAQNRQALIGLGMGLLQPRSLAVGAPTSSAWTNALGGYQQGAQADAANAYRQAQLAHTKRQEDFQRSQAAQAQANFERTFARSGEGDFSRVARELGLSPNTPEYADAAKKYYQGKTEGDWSIAEVQHPLYPDQKVPVWANKRTRETVPFTPGSSAPGTTGVASTPDVFTSGTAPVYGRGAGGFSVSATPSAAIPPTQTIPGRAFPPPPPGANFSEYQKEMTKDYIKKQNEAEQKAKRAGMIDPVGEDIDRAINAVQANPNLTTGLGGQLLRNLPNTKAGDVEGLINTIKANSSFEKMQEMRAASPTGSTGLGAVTKDEHKLLQNAIGELDQSRSTAQLLANLDRVKRMRFEMIHGPGTAPAPQFQPPAEQRAPSARQTGGAAAAPRPGFVKGGYVFKGGDPSDQSNWAPVR